MIVAAPQRSLRAWRIPLLLAALAYVAIVFYAVTTAGQALEASPSVALGLAVFPVCAYLSVRYPLSVPFALYVALMPFDSVLVVSGATLPRFAAILLGGSLAIHAIVKRRASVPAAAWRVWAIYMGFVMLSILWAQDPANGQAVGFTMLQLFVLTTALAIYPIEPSEFEIAIGLIVPCGVAAALYALRLYFTGNTAQWGDSNLVQVATSSGVVLDHNGFAASFVIPIAVALAIAFYAKKLVLRVACTAAALVMFAGDLLTGSRGGFLAAVAVLVYFGLRTKYRLQTFGVMIGGAALSLFFPAVWNRFANDPSEAGSGSGRTFIWETGLHSFKDHWLFGSGIGSFGLEYDKNFFEVYQHAFQGWARPPHSIIVGSLVELGVIGCFLVCWAWFASFRQMKDIKPSSPRYRYRIAFEGILIGLFGMSLTIDPNWVKFMWLANALPLMLANVERPRYLTPNSRTE